MRFKTLTMIISLLTVLLSACGIKVSDPLDGSSWELYAWDKTRPVEGTTITIQFEAGQVSGSSGCNTYGGSYRVRGNTLQVEGLVSTLMACADPALMEQESIYLQFLGGAQTFELTEGQLQVFGSGEEALTFVPAR